tara:strand:+ start:596 stop:919 length:324 start_codon:yes stop_codon:yes gene_type:complete
MDDKNLPLVNVGSLIRLKDNVYTSEDSDIAADNYGHPAIFADYWYGWFDMFFSSGSLGVITKVNDMGAKVYLFEKKKEWFFFHNEYQVVSKLESKKITAEIYPSSSL